MSEREEIFASNIEEVKKAARLRATFDLTIPGVGKIKRCRYLETAEHRGYIRGPSLQDKFLGWVSTVEFEKPFRKEILRAFRAAKASGVGADEPFDDDYDQSDDE